MADHDIEISYSKVPPGQVGPVPRKMKLSSSFRFICHDKGDLTVEFTKGSPLKDGSVKVQKDKDFVAAKPGRFPFKCTLERPNAKPIVIGDPTQPQSPAGGELEIGPE